MNHFAAIFKKQLKDALKNKEVLIQFVMFPVLTVVMTSGVKLDGMPENFFISLFAAMYICMAPLSSAAALIAEEKEKGTAACASDVRCKATGIYSRYRRRFAH